MSSTLQERHSIQWTLNQLQSTLERLQDRYNTYADLQYQLRLLSSQVSCTELALSCIPMWIMAPCCEVPFPRSQYGAPEVKSPASKLGMASPPFGVS